MPYGNSSAAGDVGVARTGSLADHVDLLEAGVTMKSFELVVGLEQAVALNARSPGDRWYGHPGRDLGSAEKVTSRPPLPCADSLRRLLRTLTDAHARRPCRSKTGVDRVQTCVAHRC